MAPTFAPLKATSSTSNHIQSFLCNGQQISDFSEIHKFKMAYGNSREDAEYEQYMDNQDQVFTSNTTFDTAPLRYYVPFQQSQETKQDSVVVQPYDIESLILEIESYPCLWNTSTRSHHDQHMRINSWEEIGKKFGKPGFFIFTLLKYDHAKYINNCLKHNTADWTVMSSLTLVITLNYIYITPPDYLAYMQGCDK